MKYLALVHLALGILLAPTDAKEPAATYKTLADLAYREGDSLTEGMKERCKLDLYRPEAKPGFSTVIWFHGGGLTGGNKAIPEQLRNQGVAVAAVNYRLSPDVPVTGCIEDAAAATAWVFQHIADYGGSPERIFVSGHSAGGYLASMIGLDKHWLAAHDVDANRIAGLIPFSGHTITHFTARKERGIKDTQPVVDELAPLFHVRADAPPILLITGDRELEMLGRYEENAYFWRMLKVAGHPHCDLKELQGYDHGGMAAPAFPLLLRFINGTEK
jgi:acetyl esterase/lipase